MCGQVLVTVPSSLVRRCKSHFHNSEQGVSFVLGVNGHVWVYPSALDVVEQSTGALSEQQRQQQQQREGAKVGAEVRRRVARMRNCFVVLAARGVEISPTTAMAAYHAAVDKGLAPPEMLVPANADEIAEQARAALQL